MTDKPIYALHYSQEDDRVGVRNLCTGAVPSNYLPAHIELPRGEKLAHSYTLSYCQACVDKQQRIQRAGARRAITHQLSKATSDVTKERQNYHQACGRVEALTAALKHPELLGVDDVKEATKHLRDCLKELTQWRKESKEALKEAEEKLEYLLERKKELEEQEALQEAKKKLERLEANKEGQK